jgi:hypothetical protein
MMSALTSGSISQLSTSVGYRLPAEATKQHGMAVDVHGFNCHF